MKGRGRPRKLTYNALDKLQWKLERTKIKFLNIRNKYLAGRMLQIALESVCKDKLKNLGSFRPGLTDKSGVQNVGRLIYDRKNKTFDPGKEVALDLKHNPPRIRILLTDGTRMDVPLRCPLCGVNVAFQIEGEREVYCPSGCFTWKVTNVEKYMEKEIAEGDIS